MSQGEQFGMAVANFITKM